MCLFFPRRCLLCSEVVEWHRTLCPRCDRHAPRIFPPVCPLCGRGEELCSCRKRQRSFERCISPFYFQKQVKSGIVSLKKNGFTYAVEGFAGEMAEAIRREYGGIVFDGIVPVPLFPAEERSRGFNPSWLLAKELSRQLDVPCLPLIRKITETVPQKTLTALERSGNLLGVFDVDCPDKVEGKTFLLVDDVITTGSTLDECAKMLKIYGAVAVYGATAAATGGEKDG